MKNKSHSILALIPPTDEGELLLNQALYFQRALEIRIFILNVIKSPSLIFNIFHAQKTIHLKNEALRELKNLVKSVIQKEIPKNIILRVKAGEIVPTLINQTKKGGYEFIIIDQSKSSTEGAMSMNEIDKFVSQSHCPVLTVNKDYPVSNIKKIIIPIDVSQTTKKRLLWATLFAKKFNAKIQIVSALNVNIDETKSLAFKQAEKITRMLSDRGVECDVKILKAHKQEKHKVILKYIEQEKPEMVIIRTHEESAFSGTNINKFVSEIVHGCKMPVFTVCYSKKHFPSDI